MNCENREITVFLQLTFFKKATTKHNYNIKEDAERHRACIAQRFIDV